MGKKWIATIGAGVLAAGIFGLAGPANAATSNCALYTACSWGDANYVTGGNGAADLNFTYCVDNMNNYHYYNTSTSAGLSATSIYNHGYYEATYYFTGAYESGNHVLTEPVGVGDSNLASQAPAANNSIQSAYFTGELNETGTSTCS